MDSKTNHTHVRVPKLGVQGSVIAWLDPWAGEVSDQYMRTGTGRVYPSQDPPPSRHVFLDLLQKLKADFYVHHVFPKLEGQQRLLLDMRERGIQLVLGNEYGNINGPWVEGTNRYDVSDHVLLEAAKSGQLIGLLYDEPEHLQINAAQYRKDGWFPHWGNCDAGDIERSREQFVKAISHRVHHVQHVLTAASFDSRAVPLVAEHVFPVLFHVQARGGMALCPKIMKEEFQSIQLAAALGAAKQYDRDMWICADLWGPDVGPWMIRTPGFPGHSPEEYASALRLGYFMGPTHLFTENIDGLAAYTPKGFKTTQFGEVWREFVEEFVPANPITWSHRDADPDIAFIYSDDSNYGQNERAFGNRSIPMPETSKSVFAIWHLLSHGMLPAHGNNMHIPGYSFPRHKLKRQVPADQFPLAEGIALDATPNMHPLFYPMNNVLVFDDIVTEARLGNPQLIFVAGSSVSDATLRAVRKKAEAGAAVIVAKWLLPAKWLRAERFGNGGIWLPADDFLDESVREQASPHLGSPDCWMQRFDRTEIRIYKKDPAGFTLDFDIQTIY
jgi:hypothetical protein